jgi:glycosidase
MGYEVDEYGVPLGEDGKAAWWTGVIYQVYPRSFQDTTGNGVGDLAGITARLPYLADLGVDALWISPFYPSPMADFGYDVSDYTDVDPLFGSLDDFDDLLAEAHRMGLRVVIDWVPNHTSDRHPWFVESRSDRVNPRRDWYVWRDPKPDGSRPNNWLSMFGGPAWTWDAGTEQYYLHSFLAEQPDLNWRDEQVQDAMFSAIRFWLDRGVDGFRIDVAHFVMKDPALRDNLEHPAPPRSKGHHDAHGVYRDLRSILDGYDGEHFSVGEIHIDDPTEWASYYGEGNDELHMPFNFSLLKAPWDATAIRDRVETIEAAVPPGGWPNYVLGNHDEQRITGRLGRDQARVAMMLLLTLRGTATLYYGDEIGMRDREISPEAQQDPFGRRVPGEGRDGCRTPMQWESGVAAGFSPAPERDLWLPLGDDFATINVAVESDDPASMLTLTRNLLALRKRIPALRAGTYRGLDGLPDDVYGYERRSGSNRIRVLLSFSDEARMVTVDPGRVLLSTDPGRATDGGGSITLGPNEGVVLA